jgi:DNA topoisomerase IB
VRDESKYEHLLEFGQALPAIRRIVEGLSKVLVKAPVL